MTQGVLYYNHGTQCLSRLAVSLMSLREHYAGPVAIAAEGTPPQWFLDILKEFGATLVAAPVTAEYGLIKKSRLWRISPFEHTMFLDADTLVRGPIDEFFGWIKEYGLVVTHFNDWHTHRGRIRRRIEQWRHIDAKLVDKAIAYGGAINTGIMGWTRGNPGMAAYEAMTILGNEKRGMSRKTLDELAMQLIVTEHRHYLACSMWNTGCVHGDGDKARVVHYHGHKHCRQGVNGDMWKAAFKCLVQRFPKANLVAEPQDGSISHWIAQECCRQKDLTIVTAVTPEYAERAAKAFPMWMNTPGLKEQKFIVFVKGFKRAEDRKFLEYPNVKMIRWDYPFPANIKETMFASFVFGVAQHVRTEYWMKLDSDAVPLVPMFMWPEYKKATITSHRWHYTKPRGSEEHWFSLMDRLFSDGNPVMKRELKPSEIIVHRPGNPDGLNERFSSFCHIEKTSFTKRMAEEINKRSAGRLPIPSQDTLSWYFATLWKEPVTILDFGNRQVAGCGKKLGRDIARCKARLRKLAFNVNHPEWTT